MGAYNTVSARATCPSCKNDAVFTVQFKYGELWQYEYQVGDLIRWGERLRGSDEGRPGCERVVVEGVAEGCPSCGAEGGDFEIALERDRIVDVHPLSDPHKFRDNNYIIIH